jgi:hypothetical protein
MTLAPFFTVSASTNTISSASTNLVLTGVFPASVSGGAPTNRVEVEGAIVAEHQRVLQKTIDGWVVCPRDRKFVIIQYVSGSGTAVVRDNRGELVRLDSVFRAVVFSGDDTLESAFYINAVGGDVVVFYSQR